MDKDIEKFKILIVEDDKDVALAISDYLDDSGYTTFIADNGGKAIEMLDKSKGDIDLIVTDINMPGMDGIAFCRSIRASEEYKFLPVLMLTGRVDISSKYLAYTVGTDDYLTKPFEPIELLLRIQALIRRSSVYKTTNSAKKEFETLLAPEGKPFRSSSITICGKEVSLTALEFDIFYYFYMNSGRNISSEEILNKVLKYPEKSGNPGVVRTHIKNIRVKIETDSHNPKILMHTPKKGYYMDKSQLS